MYSYQLRLEDDILRVGFNRIQPAPGNKIVEDALAQLDQMIASGQLSGGQGVLKIDGPQSVPVAYVLAHRLSHLYEVIAVLDPKISRKGYKTYIVVITHGSVNYRVGQIIETQDPYVERSPLKVVLCGPPQTGKSCFREGLKEAILGHLNAPYPYIITACPDGEGSWHQRTYSNNQPLAQYMKLNNKGELTPEFAKEAAQWVRSANQAITIIDVGGKTSQENQLIMREASHAVILYKTPEEEEQWQKFCQDLGLIIIARIQSQLEAANDEVIWLDNWQVDTLNKVEQSALITGKVHGLSRNSRELVDFPMIQSIASVLIYLASLNGGKIKKFE